MLLEPFSIERDGVSVEITLEALIDDGIRVAGIFHVTGKIALGPKAWVRAVRDEVARIEKIAKCAGCDELRLQGRDWSRILPDYEPMTDAPQLRNGLRKRLT